MKKVITKALMVSLILGQLAGCSTLVGSATTYSQYANDRETADKTQNIKQNKSSLIKHVSGIYVDTTPLKVSDQKTKLLETFPGNIIIASKSLMSIREITDKVTKLTGIPVKYNDLGQIDGSGQKSSAATNSSKELSDLGISEPLPESMGINELYSSSNSGSLGFPSDIPAIDARFDGKLTDFLDHVSGRMGLFWKFDYEDKRIVFYKFDTKTFSLHMMPGDIVADATLTNTTSASSKDTNSQSTSMAGQSVKLSSSIKAWEQTTKTIEKMLSKSGGRYESNEALGTIVVTDTPMVLADIGRYVEHVNKVMSRQVSFDVVIYDVELDDENLLGVDWNFVWNEAGKFATGFTAASSTASAAASGVNFLSKFSSKPDMSGLADPKTLNGANTSTAFIRALETQGRLSLKTHQQTMTLNNTPVPVKVADETTYLASASSGTTAASSSTGTLTTSLTPGKVVSGLTMTLLPRIFDANQLMLQMSMDITDLKSIATITSGTSSIQAPKISTKSFIQRVAVNNGETLVMSGFDQDKHSVNSDQSLNIPGGLGRSEKHVVTVIMITPRITEGVSTM